MVLNKADLAGSCPSQGSGRLILAGSRNSTLALNSKEQSAVKKVTDAAKKLMADKLARQKRGEFA